MCRSHNSSTGDIMGHTVSNPTEYGTTPTSEHWNWTNAHMPTDGELGDRSPDLMNCIFCSTMWMTGYIALFSWGSDCT